MRTDLRCRDALHPAIRRRRRDFLLSNAPISPANRDCPGSERDGFIERDQQVSKGGANKDKLKFRF